MLSNFTPSTRPSQLIMEWATQNQMSGKGKLWVFADATYASHFIPLNDATKSAADGAIRILAAGGTKDNKNWNKVSTCNLKARTRHAVFIFELAMLQL